MFDWKKEAITVLIFLINALILYSISHFQEKKGIFLKKMKKELWAQKGVASGKDFVIVAIVQRNLRTDKTFNTTVKKIIYKKNYDYIKVGSVIALKDADLATSKSKTIQLLFEEISG